MRNLLCERTLASPALANWGRALQGEADAMRNFERMQRRHVQAHVKQVLSVASAAALCSSSPVHGKALRDCSQNLRSPIAESFFCDNTRRSCRLASRSCDARWQIVSPPPKNISSVGPRTERGSVINACCKVGGRPVDRLHCTSTFADASALTSRLIKGHARASESTRQQHKANSSKPESPLELRCHTHMQ